MATSQQFAQLMDKLRAGEPWRLDGNLYRKNKSVATILDKKALVHAGVDTEDPGGYSGWYFPDDQVMVIDLSDGDDDE